MRHVELAPRAQRELARALERPPAAGGGPPALSRPVRLKGPLYRLTVGPYRIVYALSDHGRTVVALKIARRDDSPGRPDRLP